MSKQIKEQRYEGRIPDPLTIDKKAIQKVQDKKYWYTDLSPELLNSKDYLENKVTYKEHLEAVLHNLRLVVCVPLKYKKDGSRLSELCKTAHREFYRFNCCLKTMDARNEIVHENRLSYDEIIELLKKYANPDSANKSMIRFIQSGDDLGTGLIYIPLDEEFSLIEERFIKIIHGYFAMKIKDLGFVYLPDTSNRLCLFNPFYKGVVPARYNVHNASSGITTSYLTKAWKYSN